jgi:cytoskeletal protein RodZ
MEKTKSKSAKKSKKHKSKIKGEKKESQKGNKLEKNGLVHLHLFCFFDLLFAFAFILLFSAIFQAKSPPPKKKQIEKAK